MQVVCPSTAGTASSLSWQEDIDRMLAPDRAKSRSSWGCRRLQLWGSLGWAFPLGNPGQDSAIPSKYVSEEGWVLAL